ncbi:MAG: phenylacetic acid degradation operon negative regulatory protein PaaX [Gammaproteobacteria bacterium]|nr:phenylacetic acid degradation operon negative regulatory protein PaaX [Gammaproteobacteria bacterium]MBI5617446.1 phenylacetic acid degradation operon negative regulatory protein PaaX [Gammaproteobacteria bacterium]
MINPGAPTPIEAETAALIRRFRRQRPVRAGSLIVTIFGDAIAPRGGEIALGSLIELTTPFGLNERLVRTSVSRLIAAGWLASTRVGRRSLYALTPCGRERFAAATLRIYGQNPETWPGRWTLVVFGPNLGPRREQIRDELAWLGFGQLAPGVHAHPTLSLDTTRAELTKLAALNDVTVLDGATHDAATDRRIADQAWDMAELARRYRAFITMFEPVDAVVANDVAPPDVAFQIRTLLVHEYRKIHLRDPLLPTSLLPGNWIGTRAYALCARLYAKVFASAEIHLEENAGTLTGPLPPPIATTFERFGGLVRPTARPPKSDGAAIANSR